MLRRRRALELLLLRPRGSASCWNLSHRKMPPWAALIPPGTKMPRPCEREVNQLFPVVRLKDAFRRCPRGALPVEQGFVVDQGPKANAYYIARARSRAKGIVKRLLEATEAASPVLRVEGRRVSVVNRQVDPEAIVRELDRAWRPLHRPLGQRIVLGVLGAVRNCSAGLHFFQWAIAQRSLAVDTTLYNGLVEMLIMRDFMPQALRLFARMKRAEFVDAGCGANAETLAIVVRPLCDSNLDKALELVNDALLGRAIDVSDELLHDVIERLCKLQGKLPLSLRYFHHMKDPSDRTYQLLVRTMSKEQFVYEAYDLIVSMEVGRGFPTDDVTYHLLIAEFCRRKEVSRAHVLLHDFMDRGRTPSVVTFNAVLELLCGKGDRDAAEKAWNLFLAMKKAGVAPNTITYSIVLQALANGNRVDQAMILLDDMLRSGCVPGRVTGSALVSALVRAEKATEAFDLVLRMNREFNTPVEVDAIADTVYAFLRLKPMKSCLRAVKELRSINFFPDLDMYNALIATLCEHDMVKPALLCLRDVNRRKVPDAKSYEPLVAAFCRSGKLPVAYKLLKHMIHRGCDANLAIYKAIVSAFCRDDNLDDACKLLEFMFNKDVYPDEELYATVLEGLERTGNAQAWDVLKNALRESEGGGGGSSEVMFKAIFKLRGCVRPAAKDSKALDETGKRRRRRRREKQTDDIDETEPAEVEEALLASPDDSSSVSSAAEAAPAKVVPIRFSDSEPDSSSDSDEEGSGTSSAATAMEMEMK